jgi:hypothetical protein
MLLFLIIVGSLSIGILVAAICFELYKKTGKKNASYMPDPASNNYSPLERSIQMVRSVRQGHFLMHILTNEASPFDDDLFLKKYQSYIQNPSVIDYIQNIKGQDEYE